MKRGNNFSWVVFWSKRTLSNLASLIQPYFTAYVCYRLSRVPREQVNMLHHLYIGVCMRENAVDIKTKSVSDSISTFFTP